jgi:hypothetical protein
MRPIKTIEFPRKVSLLLEYHTHSERAEFASKWRRYSYFQTRRTSISK